MRLRLTEGPPELRQTYMRLVLDIVTVDRNANRLGPEAFALVGHVKGGGCPRRRGTPPCVRVNDPPQRSLADF